MCALPEEVSGDRIMSDESRWSDGRSTCSLAGENTVQEQHRDWTQLVRKLICKEKQ